MIAASSGLSSTSSARSGDRSVDMWGWLVEDEPVEAELTDGLDELLEIDGLADVAVRPAGVPVYQVPLLLGGGEDDDRQEAGPLGRSQLAQYIQPADLGKLEVEE